MRVEQVYASRPAYYDRNPTIGHISYEDVGIGPHSETIRGTYTVPTGKKAVIESIWIEITRFEVATSAGRTFGRVMYSTDGAVWKSIARAEVVDRTMFAKATFYGQNLGILDTGQSLRFTTFDGSTGGYCSYAIIVKLQEFNA